MILTRGEWDVRLPGTDEFVPFGVGESFQIEATRPSPSGSRRRAPTSASTPRRAVEFAAGSSPFVVRYSAIAADIDLTPDSRSSAVDVHAVRLPV